MNVDLRECSIDDLSTLRNLSHSTYDDTFSHMNSPSVMDEYLKEAFNINKLQEELLNPDSLFYFLYADGQLAGYLKLNEGSAQTDIKDPESLEIERIYLTKEYQGRGLGSALMNKAIEMANARNKTYVWLGVWEKNEKALGFYQKNGFYPIGTHSFFMGPEEQTDFVLRKDLK